MASPRYSLHPACRVRGEKFGLLFYDARGPRLLFAATGGLLDPGLLERGELAASLSNCPPHVRVRLTRLLSSLVERGYLCE